MSFQNTVPYFLTCSSVIKPEPIMLLVLPIIPSTRYSYFIPMPSPIIPVIFF